MRRRSVVAVLSASGILLLASMVAPADAASISCGNTESHRFAGYLSPTSGPATVSGTKATITSRFGYICDSISNGSTVGGNWTSAWVMLAGSGLAYAQSGIMRMLGDSSNHIYAEDSDHTGGYNGGVGFRRFYGGALAEGDMRTYWVQHVVNIGPCANRLRENYNTTIIQTTPFDPAPSCTANFGLPWNSEFMSEAKYPSTDIDGINGASEHFANMQVQQYSDDTWTSTLPTMTASLDNPVYPTITWSACQNPSPPLVCDTYVLSAISSNIFNSNTSNPH